MDEGLSLPFLQRLSPRTWMHVDEVIAVVLTAASLAVTFAAPNSDGRAAGPVGLRYACFALMGAALAVRRRQPLASLAAVATVLALLAALGGRGPTALVGAMVVYTVASTMGRRASLAASGPAMVAICVGALFARGGADWGSILSIPPLLGVGWLAGENARSRRTYAAGLADRAVEQEKERTERTLRAAADERVRIARELHDVVAHAMSVVAIRAGVARVVIDRDPDEVRNALGIIETTSKRALAEMRLLVGVLRRPEDEADFTPLPGLADLPELLAEIREAGIDLDASIAGEAPTLPAAVDLSAYRIVQEALTNVVRHAGQAKARLAVTYGAGEIEIEVVDDGGRGGAGVVAAAGEGHGLIGMRERVTIFGGHLSVGASGSGFRVYATLPYDGGDA